MNIVSMTGTGSNDPVSHKNVKKNPKLNARNYSQLENETGVYRYSYKILEYYIGNTYLKVLKFEFFFLQQNAVKKLWIYIISIFMVGYYYLNINNYY